MWPYWVLFLVPAFVAAITPGVVKTNGPKERWPLVWRATFFFLCLMLGLRHDVGGDWETYQINLETASQISLFEMLEIRLPSNDPAYGLIEWVGAQWGGLYLVNTIGAIVLSWGLVVFCRAQPRPWLALVVAVPYLIMVLGMGYTRQGISVGLEMVGLIALENKRIKSFIAYIALAASFHKSSVILVPLAVLMSTKHRMLSVVLIGVVGVLMYRLFLQESIEHLYVGYVEAEYASSGAGLRLSMNALPAALFLLFRNRLYLSVEQRSIWTWVSMVAFVLIGFLIFSPSSTAVDRVGLYLIPLQLFVWSRLPDALALWIPKKTMVLVIVVYALVVHFSWLNFADHAFAWLPYQFYPWIWLWE